MELTIGKAEFTKALARAASAADNKSTQPILACALLTAGKDSLRIDATDLFLGITLMVNATVKTPGSVAIPVKDLFERVKAMPNGPIVVTLLDKDREVVTLKAAGSARKFTIRALPGADFPTMQTTGNAAGYAFPVVTLKTLLDTTHFSISTDQTRAHLNSLLLEFSGTKAKAVSTDGHRLTLAQIEVPQTDDFKMLVPLTAVSTLRRLCDEALADDGGDASLELFRTPTIAFFSFAGYTFTAKLVEAQFPPYMQVIPQEGDGSAQVTVNRVALMDAVRAVSVASNARTGGVKLAFSKDKLLITSEDPESGDGRDEIAVDYNGKPISIGFNGAYIRDAAGAIVGDEVVLSLRGELDPMICRPPTGNALKGVVMPMRI